MNMGSTGDGYAGAVDTRYLVERIRLEYDEMPGLSLTLGQAARFWQLDQETCRLALECLVRDGFLACGRRGYLRSH